MMPPVWAEVFDRTAPPTTGPAYHGYPALRSMWMSERIHSTYPAETRVRVGETVELGDFSAVDPLLEQTGLDLVQCGFAAIDALYSSTRIVQEPATQTTAEVDHSTGRPTVRKSVGVKVEQQSLVTSTVSLYLNEHSQLKDVQFAVSNFAADMLRLPESGVILEPSSNAAGTGRVGVMGEGEPPVTEAYTLLYLLDALRRSKSPRHNHLASVCELLPTSSVESVPATADPTLRYFKLLEGVRATNQHMRQLEGLLYIVSNVCEYEPEGMGVLQLLAAVVHLGNVEVWAQIYNYDPASSGARTAQILRQGGLGAQTTNLVEGAHIPVAGLRPVARLLGLDPMELHGSLCFRQVPETFKARAAAANGRSRSSSRSGRLQGKVAEVVGRVEDMQSKNREDLQRQLELFNGTQAAGAVRGVGVTVSQVCAGRKRRVNCPQ